MEFKKIIIDGQEYTIATEDLKELIEDGVIVKIDDDYAPFWV